MMIIVHIENNAINSLWFDFYIKKLGLNIQVIRFSEPKSFLEVMYTLEYDIIMSDVDMPIMNGIEFFKILNELKIDVPKCFITGYSSKKMIRKLESISDGVITKPFNHQTLSLFFGIKIEDELKKNDLEFNNLMQQTINFIFDELSENYADDKP